MEVNTEVLVAELRATIASNEKVAPFNDVFDDPYLLGFLRGKKFNIDETMSFLEHYIEMRTVKYKKIIGPFRPFTTIMVDKGWANMLKNRDPLGRYVWVLSFSSWNPLEASVYDALAANMFFTDEGIRSYYSNFNEICIIFDCKGFCFEHVNTARPKLLLLAVELFFKCLPCRPKSIHAVNENSMVSTLYALLKPLLDKNIQQRYHFHSNRLEELHRHFPPAMLPESLGGELAWEDAFENDLIPRVKGNDDFYEKMANVSR